GGDEDVRRVLAHGDALAWRRVTGAHQYPHLGEVPIEPRELGEGLLEVLLHVVPERLERRDVEHLGLGREAVALAEQPVDRPQERGQGLSGPGRGRDQRVTPGADPGPALELGRGGRADALREPAADGGVEEVEGHAGIFAWSAVIRP